MRELFSRLHEMLSSLAATDPSCKRFGASHHRYELLAPVPELEIDTLEAQLGASLPADYREYVTAFSAGGVGPYYGLLPARRAAEHVVAAPRHVTEWQRALPVAHLGCGYVAVMAIDGPAIGQIWLDARQLQIVSVAWPSFTAFVLDWIDRLARSAWPEGHIPVGRCALQAALSGYLHVCEQRLGIAAGQLAGPALRDALADLGPGAIAIAAEGPLFAENATLDPCITCARMLENLVEQGLCPDVVAPGVPPLPGR